VQQVASAETLSAEKIIIADALKNISETDKNKFLFIISFNLFYILLFYQSLQKRQISFPQKQKKGQNTNSVLDYFFVAKVSSSGFESEEF